MKKIAQVISSDGQKIIAATQEDVEIGRFVVLESGALGVVTKAWEESIDKNRAAAPFMEEVGDRQQILKKHPHLMLLTVSLVEIALLVPAGVKLYESVLIVDPAAVKERLAGASVLPTLLSLNVSEAIIAKIIQNFSETERKMALRELSVWLHNDWLRLRRILNMLGQFMA